MAPHKPTNDEQDFARVVKAAVSLSIGLLGAFLYSVKDVHPRLVIEFNLGTLIAFLLCAGVSWAFCRVLFKSEFADDSSPAGTALQEKRRARSFVIFLAVSGLATAGAFLYSLKDVSSESRMEVIQGAGFAVFVLTIGGFLIHQAIRFFEEQDKANLQDSESDLDQEHDEDLK
jgi:hypothetical protein